MARLTDIGWNEFHALPLEAKRTYLERADGDGMPYHTLFAEPFENGSIELLGKERVVGHTLTIGPFKICALRLERKRVKLVPADVRKSCHKKSL